MPVRTNAFWDPNAWEITMCYEDIQHSEQMVRC